MESKALILRPGERREMITREYSFSSPDKKIYLPFWWNYHGLFMKIKKVGEGISFLELHGPKAYLYVGYRFIEEINAKWEINWLIKNDCLDNANCYVFLDDPLEYDITKPGAKYKRAMRGASIRGSVFVSTGELRAAFGISEECSETGRHICEMYGGDVAEVGKFIRWGNFLNIPSPGTGENNDPNISVFLHKEIKNVIEKLTVKPKYWDEIAKVPW